jgi:hypothetical protein
MSHAACLYHQANGQQQQQQQQQHARVPKLQQSVASAAGPSSNVAQQRRSCHGLPDLPDLPHTRQRSIKPYSRKKQDDGATAVGGLWAGPYVLSVIRHSILLGMVRCHVQRSMAHDSSC